MNPGKTLIIFGAVLVAVGLYLLLGGKLPSFGQIPGDFVFRKGNVTIYIPLTTCLLLSAILSLLFFLARR